MGKKRGMVQLFDESGNIVVCTVIQAEPNVVTQIKTKESDGYNAIQLGFEKVQQKIHVAKNNEQKNHNVVIFKKRA